MPNLQEIDGMLYLPRVKQLDDAKRSISRGYYLLITAPLKSGISSFFKILHQHLIENYPLWTIIHLDLTTKLSVVDEIDEGLLASRQSKRKTCYDSCLFGGCFVGKMKSVGVIDDSPGRVILMLDGLQQVSKSEQINLLQNLRVSYYKKQECSKLQKLIFILGGAVNLDIIDPDKISPFYASQEIRLLDFTLDEARNFIRQFFNEHRIRSSELVELYLYDVTLGHPYLLATLCQIIVDRGTVEGSLVFSTAQRVVEEIITGRDELLSLLKLELQKINAETTDLLVRVLNGSLVNVSQNPCLVELMRLGLVYPERNYIRLRNPIFERFLRTDAQLLSSVFKGRVAPITQVVVTTSNINEYGFHQLFQIENTLRVFITGKLFAKAGDQWTTMIPAKILDQLNNRLIEDFIPNREPILWYANLDHLQQIILSLWEDIFEQYFNTLERLDEFFESLRLVRSKLNYNRNLTDVEISKFEAALQYFYSVITHNENSKRQQNIRKSSKSATDLILQVGQCLNDQYEIQKVISYTGHSQIVKGLDKRLDRAVVIKSLHLPQEVIDEAAEKRLLREAKILAKLNHPSIGHLYHIMLNPLRIVMEWIEGEPLQHYLDTREQLPPFLVVKIGSRLVDALRSVHNCQVVHRDIKPNNIILTRSKKPVLIDFDIAHAGHQPTITSLKGGARGYVGTKRYSPPEQLNFYEVGPSADLFALGVVLYELLTHKVPYPAGNRPSRYEGGHLPKPEQYDIPNPLYQILCSLLLEEPEQRPTATDLQKELKSCLSLLGVAYGNVKY